MKKRLLIAAASSAAILCSYAQINSPAADGYIARAVAMYDDGNYFGCIDQLIMADDEYLTYDQRQQLDLYRGLATVYTDKQEAAELLHAFLDKYPSSIHVPEALLALGDCYYGVDYSRALHYYNNIYPEALNGTKKDYLLYRKAYCYLKLDKLTDALPLFQQLSDAPGYANASAFYMGYIAYAQGKYVDAERLLKTVDKSSAPGNMADFYLSQIYYMNDDYTRALSTAKSLLRNKDIAKEFEAEANRIAGESSFQLGEDTQAIGYLDKYVYMTEAPLPSALYILGINAYNSGDYDEAIEYLTPVTEADNAMGQSAYLFVGQAYMHEGDYSAAAMALDRALKIDYDPEVRETAYYNYAVASANGGKAPFASTIKIFSDFINLYPNSQYAPQVQDYIITSYITDGNYSAALESINKMAKPTDASLSAKQRVLYVLGNKALATAEYPKALTYLQEADKLARYDRQLAPEVSLALGEAYYRQGDYAKAVTEIQKYLKTSPNGTNAPLAHYDLGYAYYAQKKYAEAGKQLSAMLDNSGSLPSTVIADAYNRLGDCYYFDKNFTKAEQAYENAYQQNPNAGDYALFQKALMAGYQHEYQQKIQTLQRLQSEFPTSALIPDALLETTESYIQLGNNKNALVVYNTLVDRYPNTAQGRQGYIQMALVKLNTGDRKGAIHDYKEVIRRYPSSDEARQAVDQMKTIAAADGTLHEFMAFLKNVDNAPQIDESEAEQLTFENAERMYLVDHKTEALESFVDEYPESNMRARALSYLMNAEIANGHDDAAYDYAVSIVEQYPASPYTQAALIHKANTEEAQGKGNLALRTWQQLAQTASSADALLTARMGVIRNGRAGGQYDDVLSAAGAVISSSGVGAADMAEAIYSRAWVLSANGNEAAARNEWQKIADQTDLLYGIMSAVNLGESYYNSKEYNLAENYAKKVVNADSPHMYWIARGFIILSDVYAAQGDKYKARQYLEAVRDNYSGGDDDDIFQMIDQRLK